MPRALRSERSCFQGGHLEVLGRPSRTSFPLIVSSVSITRSESWDSRIPHRPHYCLDPQTPPPVLGSHTLFHFAPAEPQGQW